MHDAVILSDLHLGSDNCEAKALVSLLESIRSGELHTNRLVLNGDVFDSIDFRRLKKNHWKVLSILRKLSDELEIVWVNGNHDGPSEIVSHLLGVLCRDECVFESGGKIVLCLHGHRFDEFIESYPIATWFADRLYRFLQKLDRTHAFAKYAKKSSKTFLRCAKLIEERAIVYAEWRGADVVCCGHSHLPAAVTAGRVEYFNSGCWTEKPCHYLTVTNGVVELQSFNEPIVTVETNGVQTSHTLSSLSA
ncbi:MAG TPA: metallophosphoesterase family protein [Fimbriiglobus sp.]|jgi:UDP-2,3-diacylglucosamine pyrophosphatase LpxH